MSYDWRAKAIKLSPSKQNILNQQSLGLLFTYSHCSWSLERDSIKNSERRRRRRSKEMIIFDKISLNEMLQWYYNLLSVYCQQNCIPGILCWLAYYRYQQSKPVYLGTWLVSAGCASLFPTLNCTHKEADDEMMFHVQAILSHQSGPTSMTWTLGDTDVFVCLLYHVTVPWKDVGLQEIWLNCNSGMRILILPLHDICTAMKASSHCVSQRSMHWLDVIPPTIFLLNLQHWMKAVQKTLSLIHNSNISGLTKHDADGRNTSGPVSQANNRPGNIWCLTSHCV